MFFIVIDKWFPFLSNSTNQKSSKNLINESGETVLQSNGIYSDIAHILNRLIFAIFTLIYIFNILFTLLFS